jgi:hypothetical protein
MNLLQGPPFSWFFSYRYHMVNCYFHSWLVVKLKRALKTLVILEVALLQVPVVYLCKSALLLGSSLQSLSPWNIIRQRLLFYFSFISVLPVWNLQQCFAWCPTVWHAALSILAWFCSQTSLNITHTFGPYIPRLSNSITGPITFR